jgi:hypothetical protein
VGKEEQIGQNEEEDEDSHRRRKLGSAFRPGEVPENREADNLTEMTAASKNQTAIPVEWRDPETATRFRPAFLAA